MPLGPFPPSSGQSNALPPGEVVGRGLLVFGSVLVCVLLGELAFRVHASLEDRGLLTASLELPTDPPPGQRVTLGEMIRRSPNRRLIYELRPDLQVTYAGERVTTNARGFRGTLHPIPRGPDTFRIVGIGDSHMFGQGVSDGETYLEHLEARLRDSDRSRTFEVINSAVPGYNAVMEVETLRTKGLEYEPDLVIMEFVGNDLDLPNFLWAPREIWSLDRSFLLARVERALRTRDRSASAAFDARDLSTAPTEVRHSTVRYVGDPSRVPPQYRHLVGWDAYRRALQELAELRDRHGFDVIVIRPGTLPLERRVERIASRLGFPVLDLGPWRERYLREHGFSDSLRSPLVLRPDDAHPSVEGHRLVGEALHAFLLRHRLLRSEIEDTRRDDLTHSAGSSGSGRSPGPVTEGSRD